MKTVVIVAPHFLPSFLPSVHRSRLWAYHLAEFDWKPIILTTDPKYYECQVDWDLMALLPDGVDLVRTRAAPTKPIRIIGDIALRSFYWYWKALQRLAEDGKMDFLHFTIPASNAALLGPLVYRKYGIPYGIDYIDPWIHETDTGERPFSKVWLAQKLAQVLEPIAVRDARLITGINHAYFNSVLLRNPHLQTRAETEGMPYGGSKKDFEALEKKARQPFLFDPKDGKLHLIYAGALLPKAFVVLDRLMASLVILRNTAPDLANRLRIHFVGTGMNERDSSRGHTVKPYIEKYGVSEMVQEWPSRISYLDTLNHLKLSSAILVIGSTEVHYSPSKIYQSVMSQRPVFAILHEKSTAVATMHASHAGEVFTFSEETLPDPNVLASSLKNYLVDYHYDCNEVDWQEFLSVEARETTRKLALALDRAYERERRSAGDKNA